MMQEQLIGVCLFCLSFFTCSICKALFIKPNRIPDPGALVLNDIWRPDTFLGDTRLNNNCMLLCCFVFNEFDRSLNGLHSLQDTRFQKVEFSLKIKKQPCSSYAEYVVGSIFHAPLIKIAPNTQHT